MKKLILFFAVILSLEIVSALEYPQKINNGEKLITIEKFRGIYQRIYDDVNNENLVEVCKRTLRWPKFWKKNTAGKNELIYSIENCQNLKNDNSLTNFINIANKSNTGFNKFEKYFRDKFELEKNLLRLENDLRRETGLAYIFADGSEDYKDSPFDLVSDMNEIDEIFFGEKHECPEVNFAKKTNLDVVDEIPFEKNDIWLEQTEKKLPPFDSKFKKPTDSLSGSLWHLQKEVLRENLNTFPLALSHVQKTAFDTSFAEGIPFNSGMTAETTSIPNQSNDVPESLKLIYNPIGKLNALINYYILSQSTQKDSEITQEMERNKRQQIVLSSEEAKKNLIKKKLNIFEKENSRESENNNFTASSLSFNQQSQIFNLFTEKIHYLNEEILPSFTNEKPIYSN